MRLFSDVRYALRALARTPGFTAAAVLVLALGIGANSAVFSVLYSVLLARLPYVEPDRLVWVWEHLPNMPDPPGGRIQVCRRNYLEWKRQNSVFSGMAAFLMRTTTETGIPVSARIDTAFAGIDLFPLLGVRPRLGRGFAPDEEQPGRDRVAVLSDRYFERRFGRDPNCLGKSIVLDRVAYTVIGVLPQRFHLPAYGEGSEQPKAEVWVPLSRLWEGKAEDDVKRQLLVLARMKPRISLAQARVEMAVIGERLAKADPALNEIWKTNVFSVPEDDVSPELRLALFMLLTAVGFVLLIACANLANLMLARASRRTRDFGIRIALGAARRHVVSQLLTEALIVAFSGAALGLLLAHWGVRAMLRVGLEEIPRQEFIRINAPVFGFAAAAAVLTAILFGLAPALAAARTDVLSALKTGGGSGVPTAHQRHRDVLVAVEVALALMLLTGAGLLMRSFHLLATAELGFHPDEVLTFDVDLPERTYKDQQARANFNRRLLERLQALPGVVSAAISDGLPYHKISVQTLDIVGRPAPKPGELLLIDSADVTPGYFSTMGVTLKAGRLFTDADMNRPVVIVNEAAARRFWPKENALGQHILCGDKPRGPCEIVGVVADHHQFGAENDVRVEAFYPWVGMPSPIVVLRVKGNPLSLSSAAVRAVQEIDRQLTPYHMWSMRQVVDEFLVQRRFFTWLIGVFAAIALVLAATGIYGVLSHVVSSRTHEIGIRMALGAARSDVLSFVFRRSLIPAGAGFAIGLAGALAVTRYLAKFLFGVRPRDPVTILGVTLAIAAVAAAATWIPARRAARLDPNVALREE